MKLSGPAALQFIARPDPGAPGALIYGADSMKVALKRQELLLAIAGPTADADMRLTRMPGADLRRDPALLVDAIKAVGFFPGPRAVFVEDAGEAAFDAIATALAAWRPGDAQIVVTAGQLPATSKLRKLFEGHRAAPAIALYDDPPSRAEIAADLARAGLRDIPPGALQDLTDLARDLTPGDFRQTLEKLALYKLGDATPLTPDDIAAVAPATVDTDMDAALNAVADRDPARLGAVLQRLQTQGVQPVALILAAARHFRALHAAASDPNGAAAGLSRMRPPVFGPRRDRMLRQVQGWQIADLESALRQIIDTDLTLRSAGQTAPQMALVERVLLRLALSRR